MRRVAVSDQEILENLMDFTTVDLINVTAYLAMSLGQYQGSQGIIFSGRNIPIFHPHRKKNFTNFQKYHTSPSRL